MQDLANLDPRFLVVKADEYNPSEGLQSSSGLIMLLAEDESKKTLYESPPPVNRSPKAGVSFLCPGHLRMYAGRGVGFI